MRTWRAFAQTVNLVSLAIWLGTIVMSGVFAARIFAVMRDLEPHLKAYDAYTGEHWKLAGGKVANEIFFIGDIIQFSCAFLAALSFAGLILLRALNVRRLSTWIRGIGLSVAMSSVMGLLVLVNPQLNAALKQYWDAARAGNTEAALKFQTIAGEIHPFASTLMSIAAVGVLLSLIAASWTLGRDSGSDLSPSDAAASAVSGTRAASPYQEPALLRKKSR